MKTSRKTTKNQSKDAGMALVLIFLFVGFFINGFKPFDNKLADIEFTVKWPIFAATFILFLNMIWSDLFRPFGWLWFGLAELLGNISSKIVLAFIFFLVVTPLGIIRRIMGKDNLKLKLFRKDKTSVLIERGHLFSKKDIEQPF